MDLLINILGLSFFILNCSTSNNWCPKDCHCSQEKNSADCYNLNFIPELPLYVTTLRLSYCYLSYIERNSFVNVSKLAIKNIIFDHNTIYELSNDSFQDLKYLQSLKFQNEIKLDLTSLRNSFQSLNTSLIKIMLFENNGWESIPKDMFLHMTKGNLSKLSFKSNKIEQLDTTALLKLNTVDKLSFADNMIISMNASGLNNARELDLSGNHISVIPSFCSRNGSFAPNLLRLSLNGNPVDMLDTFKCLENLETLELEKLHVERITGTPFIYLKRLRTLFLGHNKQLHRIGVKFLSSSSMEKLQFDQNGFRFNYKLKKKQFIIFNYTSNLKELDLTNNILPRNKSALFAMLSPLTQIRKLLLASTSLSFIPNGLFQRMRSLHTLDLSGNSISCWDPRVFVNVRSLRILNLGGNHINFINRTSFPHGFLQSLERIDFSGNRFFCTCKQMWFLNLIHMTNITSKFKRWPIYYRCFYPAHLKGSNIADYHPTDEDCAENNYVLTILLSASAAGILFLITPIVLAVCQTNIRNAIYLFRVRRRMKSGYFKLDSSEDFEFDAFIIYCDADRRWVHENLLKRLEKENLHVCVHHRDFVVGEIITANIETHISKSFKTIVVMSNEFTKSEWCQWEIELVQDRRRRHGKEALILIMYRQIDSSHMTSPLRALLQTTPSLTYTQGFGENMFWNAVINDIKRPLTTPPIAVL